MKEVTINFLSIYLVELSLAPEGGSGRDLPGRLCLDARNRNMSGGLLVGLPSRPSIAIPMGTFVDSSLGDSFSFLSQLPIPLFPPLFCVNIMTSLSLEMSLSFWKMSLLPRFLLDFPEKRGNL